MASKIDKITRNSCSAGGDRISNLPSMLTECILEYLPLHDLVKLSFLSKHWRNIWVMLPQLILDEDFIDVTLKRSGSSKVNGWGNAYSDLVNNVLLRRTGPILKFVLYLHPYFPTSTDISHWIRFVFAKGVKQFTLIDGRRDVSYLPSCLFTSEVGLTHLTLRKCLIDSLPPTFNGFKCLTSLNLEKSCCMKVNTLQKLISSCTQLEILRITVFHFENLIIHAPKLRGLAVFGIHSSILMEETTKLNMLTLAVSLNWELSNLSCCLPNVEMLILGPQFWQSLNCKKTLNITNKFARLTALKVVGMPVYCNGAIPFVMRLCVYSPNLQHLQIKAPVDYCYDCLHTFEMKEDCTFQRLTKVELVSLSASSQNSQLIKLLLARSPNLQIMTIKLKENTEEAEEKFNITRELMSYCRASASARILFKS